MINALRFLRVKAGGTVVLLAIKLQLPSHAEYKSNSQECSSWCFSIISAGSPGEQPLTFLGPTARRQPLMYGPELVP